MNVFPSFYRWLLRLGCLSLLALHVFAPYCAAAQTDSPRAALNPQSVRLGERQLWMLRASQLVMARRFSEAVQEYDRVIGKDPGFIEAYIQRSITRREMGQDAASASDAKTAVRLINAALQKTPRDARLYYQRGMAFRVLKVFEQAKKDMRAAIELNPSRSDWRTDLQAIALEEKIAMANTRQDSGL